MSLLSDLANATNPFGTPAKGTWNLVPGSWINNDTKVQTQFYAQIKSAETTNGVLTAVDQISDSGARRLAIYEYPYVDGQRVKDLGRRGETYTFNIKFFGPNYQDKLREFYRNVYNTSSNGVLIHPVLTSVRGAIVTRLQSFDPVHKSDEWNSVTFRAVFIEDNTGTIDVNSNADEEKSADSALQQSLQDIVRLQSNVSTLIAAATAVLQIPASVTAALNARKDSLLGQLSGLMGQMAATFSNSTNLFGLLSVASGSVTGVAGVSSGAAINRSSTGVTKLSSLPPVFQVGLDSATQALVESRIDSFVNQNQVSISQAVYNANQTRASLTAAISEIESVLGNDGYDIVVQYRTMANSIQATVEACIAQAQSKVKIFALTKNMTLRQIAFANGLDPDRQNDIEALNPFLPSVNLIPKGSTVTVPAA